MKPCINGKKVAIAFYIAASAALGESVAQVPATSEQAVIGQLKSKNQTLKKDITQLKRKIIVLNKRNIILQTRIVKLERDSTVLATNLQTMLEENKRIVAKYEVQLNNLKRDMSVMSDSLLAMRDVRFQLNSMKQVLSAVNLSFRTYDYPQEILVSKLKTFFVIDRNDYKLQSSNEQRIMVQEIFEEKQKSTLLGFKKSKLVASYLLAFRPHPLDEGRTLMDVRVTLERDGREVMTLGESLKYKEQLGDHLDRYLQLQLARNE